MISNTKTKVNFIEGLDNLARSWDGQVPRWAKELRSKGLARFIELGVPTTKNEEWKYTNVAPIIQRKFQLPVEIKFTELQQLKAHLNDEEVNIVFINGAFVRELSSLDKKIKGLTVKTVQQALKDEDLEFEQLLKKYNPDDETTFVALNRALATDGAYITIAPNAVIGEVIHIVHITSPGNHEIITADHSVIAAGKSSEATILESHLAFSDKTSYLATPLTDIFLAENAVLNYCKTQKESAKAFHIGTTRVWQEGNSNLNGFSLVTSGLLTRNNLDVVLNGEGANGGINGLYCVNGQEHVDNHTSVDHRVPNCTSNQLYKGILNGSAHAVFNGKIFVRPIAQKTNSYQLNKNLLFGNECQINTKPQLEIQADDVKCTHGATIGQLNEDEIFYLQSRAIARKQAVTMLAHGFVDDILAKIGNDSIKKRADILLEPTFKALES